MTLESIAPACAAPCAELPRVAEARTRLWDADALQERAALFRVLGDPLRLQVLELLSAQALCVCDLTELLQASQSAVSNHLRILRAAKLVRTRREGKLIFYTLDSPELAALLAIVRPLERTPS